MQKWEYRVEISENWFGQVVLNSAGRNGWELVNIIFDGNRYYLYLKRPLT